VSKIPDIESIQKIYTSKLGTGVDKRLWLESNRLKETAFTPGEPILVDLEPNKAVITTNLLSNKTVAKRKDKPVIDIQNKEFSKAFAGVTNVTIRIFSDRIEIEPLAEETMQKEAKAKAENPLTFTELFSGGGTLSECFKMAGFKPVAAVELEDKYLETYELNNPGCLTINSPIQNVDWTALPATDVLLAGIPCDNWCPAGKAKAKDTGKAVEEAGDTGYLAYYFLEAMRVMRPGFAVVEEVIGFAKSAIADVVRNVLRVMGYHLTETIFTSSEMGGMTKRKRYCMVASMKGPIKIPQSARFTQKKVRDILEIPMSERVWLTEETNQSIATFLRRERENNKTDSKRNFGVGRVDPDDSITPTVTKHYTKKQMTQPILYNKETEEYSFFTSRELARLNGLPDSYVLPSSETTACEIVGQGVDVIAFSKVAEAIMNSKYKFNN